MVMESEVSKILQGQVVATADYSNARKIIGVSDDHIKDDPTTGVCPLGKQGAFTKTETAIETFEPVNAAPAEAVTETLDFSATPTPSPEPAPITLGEAPAAAPEGPKFILPEAAVSDVAVGNPVEVESLDALQTMIPDKPIEAPTEAVVEEVPTELSLPVMDDKVVAEAPIGVNEALFVGGPEAAAPVELPQTTPTVETPSTGNINEGVLKILDEFQAKLRETDAEIEKLKAELGQTKTEAPEGEITLTEAPGPAPMTLDAAPEQQDSLMAAALDQINQIAVPDLDTPTLDGPTLGGPTL